MLVKFRHGIVKQPRGIHGEPNFLKLNGNTVSLHASSESPVTVLFSYLDMDYLGEVQDSTLTCKIDTNQSFIFLEMDVLTGEIGLGSTNFPIFYTDNEPQDVVSGQHWFDVNDFVMRVFDGTQWRDTFRVMVGEVTHGVLTQYKIGGKINKPATGKYITMDTFGYPMRISKPKDKIGQLPRFQSSVVKDLTKTKTLVKFGDFLVGAKTVHPTHSHTLVHLLPNKRIITADSTDPYTRVIGMVINPSPANTLVDIKTFGFITNEFWYWTDAEISRPLFCDANGNPTTKPPTNGVIQQVGFVCSTNTMFLDIKRPIIVATPRDTFSVVPGDLIPSVKISFKKEKKFVGGEFLIDFQDEPQQIFSGDGVSINYQSVSNKIIQGGDLTFSYTTNEINLFTDSTEILYSFNVVDPNTFSAGKEIKLLNFSKYIETNFNGEITPFTFNTVLVNNFEGEYEPNLLGFSIYDLHEFRPKSENGVIAYSTIPTKTFVPASEIVFQINAIEKTVFYGTIAGTWTFESVACNLFGGTTIEHTMQLKYETNVKNFVAGNAMQLIKFAH